MLGRIDLPKNPNDTRSNEQLVEDFLTSKGVKKAVLKTPEEKQKEKGDHKNMAEKTYFEILQEQAAAAAAAGAQQGPALGVGLHRFTIIGGVSGTKDGREWSAVAARHTNGSEYRLFYNLYWPLKDGEITPQLNVNVFNWIVGFNPNGLAGYTEKSFDKYFNGLVGKQFEVNYTMSKQNKVVLDFKTLPVETTIAEEILEVDEINFDAVE